jgi:hypothetical protein
MCIRKPIKPLPYYRKFNLAIYRSMKMAPKVGLEPTTNRLTVDCSTTELLRNGGPKWTRTIDLTLIRRAL